MRTNPSLEAWIDVLNDIGRGLAPPCLAFPGTLGRMKRHVGAGTGKRRVGFWFASEHAVNGVPGNMSASEDQALTRVNRCALGELTINTSYTFT